jgi:hypothetical protein
MSITIAPILRALVSEDGDIAVLRGPTHEYTDHISVRRADGRAMRFAVVCSREMLNDLVRASFVKQDGPENERQITMFKLTDDGRRAAELSFIPRVSPLEPQLFIKGPHGNAVTFEVRDGRLIPSQPVKTV